MTNSEGANAQVQADAVTNYRSGMGVREDAKAEGLFSVVCRNAAGEIKWEENFPNVVTTVGRNLALDTILAGSAYTVVGPFLGLISSVSYTAVAAADTMASHTGWTEAGVTNAPTYTIPRKTLTFSAASAASKASTGTYTYAITGTGTIKGVFLVYGTGALSTIDNTAGTLYSAGTFTGGDKIVGSGDTVTVTYTATM